MGGEDVKTVVSTPSVVETTTSNPLPFLPEELIVKILLRLPVRSLLRFKRVCKTWKTLISDTKFAYNRFLNSTAYPQLVAAQNREIKSYPIESLLQNLSTTVTPVSFNTGHQDYIILSSCNGFLCLHDVYQSCVRLWNPSINWKSNSSPTFDWYEYEFLLYYGFGYDQVNDKYKFLAVSIKNDYYGEIETIIYTFGENSCKNVQDFPRCPLNHKRLGIFVSGTLN